MTQNPLPEDISRTDRIVATPPVGAETGKVTIPTTSFSSFMHPPGQTPLATAGKASMISPFELAQGQPMVAQGSTIDTLYAQVTNTQSTMDDLQSNLNYPNLKLKSSHKYILKNKLTDANANLRAGNAKMGADIPQEPNPATFTGPLAKFLSYLTDGQNQLVAAKTQLQNLKDKGDSLSPADMLLVQIKLNKAQQELDFSSVLLSKAVDNFKTLMGVQL